MRPNVKEIILMFRKIFLPREFVAVSGSNDLVSLEPGVRYLAGDVLVGRAHDHAVLGGVVFILVLDHKTLAGIVVGLALPAPAELDLVPLEVRLVLYDLDERLKTKSYYSLFYFDSLDTAENHFE